jgi:Tfp pilus assembly protein PilO
MKRPIQLVAVASKSTEVLDRAWKVDALGIVLIGVLTGLAYVAGLGPFLSAKVERARHDMAISDARTDRDEARADSERVAQVLESTRQRTRSVEISLQPFAQRHVRIGSIARLAADTELMVEQMTPAGPEAVYGTSSVVRVPITMTGKGSYTQISEFLGVLHETFRDTAVESVRLEADKASQGTVATFSVKLLWFATPDISS